MQNNAASIQGVVLGLDVGDVRIGVARAHSFARLPEPVEVVDRKKLDAVARIKSLAEEHEAEAFIIGIPAFASGKEGPQAEAVRNFSKALHDAVGLPQIYVDESYTSSEADTFLASKNWKKQTSNDALAACLILERYFTENAHV